MFMCILGLTYFLTHLLRLWMRAWHVTGNCARQLHSAVWRAHRPPSHGGRQHGYNSQRRTNLSICLDYGTDHPPGPPRHSVARPARQRFAGHPPLPPSLSAFFLPASRLYSVVKLGVSASLLVERNGYAEYATESLPLRLVADFCHSVYRAVWNFAVLLPH
jgi:hypothetical protein